VAINLADRDWKSSTAVARVCRPIDSDRWDWRRHTEFGNLPADVPNRLRADQSVNV